jgi:hypothetical protein
LLLQLLWWDETVSVELQQLMVPLSVGQIHNWIWSSGGMILTGKTKGITERPVSEPLLQITHRLTWARTWAPTVRSRRLTAWVVACQLTTIQSKQPTGHVAYPKSLMLST